MSEATARDHALRVAVLDVLGKEIATAYKGARGEAEEVFGPARADGQSQQKVMLPDGTEIGLISIKAGAKQVDIAEADLEAWVEEHLPGGFEEYVNERAANSLEVLDVLKAVFPDLVKRRIRPATREALLKKITENGGYLIDEDTGDKTKVADVTEGKPSGAFSYRPAKDARDQVIAAWQRGDLKAAVPFALPAGGDSE
jgi:hypothetical protein